MPTTASITPAEILRFWRAAGAAKWFTRSDLFDAEIRSLFLPTYQAAAGGALAGWEAEPEGALALLILLDQMPRNMFRGSAQAYATDALALALAERALARGFDQRFALPERRFFYLPLMHSEAPADQQRCIDLCRAAGDEEGLKFAEIHADIIRRFGRFPHRNAVLGRPTAAEEQAFLDAGGFAG
jgi:uncharacterized protein (DUF924 family)